MLRDEAAGDESYTVASLFLITRVVYGVIICGEVTFPWPTQFCNSQYLNMASIHLSGQKLQGTMLYQRSHISRANSGDFS